MTPDTLHLDRGVLPLEIKEMPFAVVDLETTGIDAKGFFLADDVPTTIRARWSTRS